MHIYIFISYASSRQSQELLYLWLFGSESKKPETKPSRTGTESVLTQQGPDPAKPEPEPNRTDPFRGVDLFIFDTQADQQSDAIQRQNDRRDASMKQNDRCNSMRWNEIRRLRNAMMMNVNKLHFIALLW
jgi:hypothetical protein